MISLRTKDGSVLIEGVLGAILVLFAGCFALEYSRRTMQELILHRAAFIAARRAAIGVAPRRITAEAKRMIRRHFGKLTDENVSAWLSRNESADVAKVYLRYKMFFPFSTVGRYGVGSTPYRYKRRHHFEVTRQCSFPSSF